MKRKLILFVAALLLGSGLYAQDYHYAPDFDYHQFSDGPMIIIGQVYFNDVVQNSADIEIASFVGDEVRGRVFLMEPFPNEPELGYFAYLPCYYDSPGETFTFKVYDHAADKEYDVCTTIAIGQDDGYGNVDEPYDFRFTVEEEPTFGPEYPWVPSTAYSGNGMSVTAQIKINGQLVDRATYEVGAFCGEECRGNSLGDSGEEPLVDFTEDGLGYFAFMNIMGNDGDIINFYLYDLENNEICPLMCYATVTLVNDVELGMDIYGGDIFVIDFVSEQTFTKDIAAYTETGGYYLIASPIGEVNPENVTNMLENNHDLYYFNQSEELEWRNYEAEHFNLLPGKGYLYANSENVTLTFTGAPYNGTGEVELVKDDGADFPGWNLVGNPFDQTAYITKPFYTMNPEGTEIIAGTGNSVQAMEGIFVIAEEDEETMTFSTTNPNQSKEQIVINVAQDRGNAIDRAIVRIGQAEVLPKFMLNQNSTKMYISYNSNDYSVVRSNKNGRLPVCFQPEQDGTYTISVNTENLFVRYLHLIDRETGEDINLLLTPSYTFEAKTTGKPNRFELVFKTGLGLFKELFVKEGGDSFGFFSNGEWIINNEGDAVLQVVDVNGQILSSEEISGCVSKHIEAAPGVYMLRLIKGNDMKVQKIIVAQ